MRDKTALTLVFIKHSVVIRANFQVRDHKPIWFKLNKKQLGFQIKFNFKRANQKDT